MKVIPHILSQHAEEAAFKWLLRNRAVGQPHYRLKDLARLDSAVEAHLDGLRVAGEAGWECVREELVHAEAGEFFTTAWLALALDKRSAFEEMTGKAASMHGGDPGIEAAIVSAILWQEGPGAARIAGELLDSSQAGERRLGVIAAGRMRSLTAPRFLRLFEGHDPDLTLPLLQAAGQSNLPELLPALKSLLREASGEIRFRAAWAAAIAGDAGSVAVLREFIRADFPSAADAVALYFRRAPLAEASECQRLLAGHTATSRLAILAAGAAGLPAAADYLFDCMAIPGHARVAGEALSTITGVDLDQEDLSTDVPPDFEAGPTEDPDDDDTGMDPDENLPWPHQEKIRQWWEIRRGDFAPGMRLLLGRPLRVGDLATVLASGRQRQRAAAALELVVLQRATPLFDTAAPASRQLALLPDGAAKPTTSLSA